MSDNTSILEQRSVPNAMRGLLQICQATGMPYPIKDNSTINQRLNIVPNERPTEDETPLIRYITLGTGGHRYSASREGNVQFNVPLQHKPRHNAPFQPFPFLLLPIADDIGPSERAKYRLRREEEHAGKTYVAYYSMPIDFSGVEPKLMLRTVDEFGNVTEDEYFPTQQDLFPVPDPIVPGSSNTTSREYVVASMRFSFGLNSEQVNNLIEAAKILYGEARAATISEVMICSGVDRNISTMIGGIQTGLTEVVSMQVSSFMSTYFPAVDWPRGVVMDFDLASANPMLEYRTI